MLVSPIGTQGNVLIRPDISAEATISIRIFGAVERTRDPGVQVLGLHECGGTWEEGVRTKCANTMSALPFYHHYDYNAQILQPLSILSTPHLWISIQLRCLIVLSCILSRFFLGALKIHAQIFSGWLRSHLRASFERDRYPMQKRINRLCY